MKKFIFYLLMLTHYGSPYCLASDNSSLSLESAQSSIGTTEAPESVVEQNLAALGGDPSSMVNGCVNTITGTFIDSAIDLYVPGPDPLVVQRMYTNTNGWSINEPELIEFKNHKHPIVTHNLKGMISTFSKQGDKHRIRAENFRNGLTNCSSSFLSGRTSPHSLEMKVDTSTKSTHFTLQDGTKSSKRFEKQLRYTRKVSKTTGEGYYAYGIVYEQKSHGIKTLYNYQDSPLGWAVKEMFNINCNMQNLNSIEFSYDDFKVNPRMLAFGNKNQSGHCEYKFKNSGRRDLQQVIPLGAPESHYEYNLTTGFMTKKFQNDRCIMEIDYYDEVNPFMKVADKEHSHYGRVFCLRAPVGPDHNLHKTHQFIYEIHRDKKSRQLNITHVFDVYNQETKYSYDADHHLRSIEELGSESRTYKYFWYGKDNIHFDGNLMTKTLHDLSGKIFSCRHYIYDKNGNVIQDLLFGNLTGQNQNSPLINEMGAPLESGCERYLIQCKYSDDAFNHLLKEENGRKIIEYLYTPRTDFLQAKFIKDLSGRICYREFYTYNVNGSLIRLACDDGSSQTEDQSNITEKHITYIYYRNQLPIGLPEVIEEKYLNLSTKKEELLRKIVNFHDSYGRITRQDHYDSNGSFRYSLKWEYDAHGNLLKEINPLGYESTYSYNADDNLIIEQHPGNPFYTQHYYDQAQRLVCSTDVHPNFTLATHHSYNLLSQKVMTTDWYGHTTNFIYDRLGRLTRKIYPTIFNEDRTYYQPSESFEYDVADNPISKIDSLGHKTDIRYNIRGQPWYIHYHDGCEEKNLYTTDGLLEKSFAINGTSTHRSYDYLGRPIEQEIRAPGGELLSKTSIHYNYFHKLYELDPAGFRTDYQYDYAGRLIRVTKGEAKTAYQYDSCQRPFKIYEYFGTGENDYIVHVKDYDMIDRVIEERSEDAKGNIISKVSYVYNERNEQIQLIAYHLDKPAITNIQYDAYGDIEKITDAEGNATRCIYHHDHINSFGQTVVAKETIDPLGNVLFSENDPLGRLKFEIRRDAMGKVCQKREFFYDPIGNCIKKIDYVISPDQPERQVIQILDYDTNRNLTKLIEAAGTAEQKQTTYIYNFYRQKATVIKADGTEIQHAYDWLGRLTTFKASDDSFHYKYTYDANSNVIHVEDCINSSSTQRTFDANNRMKQETTANGLTTSYSYDGLARLTQLTLPDNSTVQYQYHGLHLNQIQRGQYTHTYQSYNLSGLLEKAQMIGKAGQVGYRLDACQRLIGIHTPFWHEEIPDGGFDKAGNLIKKKTTDTLGLIEGKFSYDSLYQLESEKGVSNHRFVYDSLYNLIQKDGYGHKINSLNQLLHDGFEENIYDANGNLIQKGHLRLGYDALDRLISVEDGDTKITYSYDDINRRLSSLYNYPGGRQKHVRYIYQGQNEIGTSDETGKITQLRVLGLGKGAELGAAVLFELNDKTYAPVHDICGNVRALIDPENGAVVETYRFTAYGQEDIYNTDNSPISLPINPWRFSSKRVDPETSFIHFGRRYYNPATARWVTADPLGFDVGPNLYAYLFNNPLTHFDLYGLEKCFGEDQFSHHNRRIEANRRSERSFDNRSDRSRSSQSSFTERLGSLAIGTCTLLGDFIYNLGHELMPCPILKDPFQFTGHLLRGNSPATYVMSYREQHSFYQLKYRGIEGSTSNAIAVNGIGVSLDEAIKRTEAEFKQLESRYDYYMSYNADHGFVSNLLECLCQLAGIPTNAKKVLEECMTEATSALGDYGTTFLNAHSQGGLIAYDVGRTLDQAVASRIDAFTIGSPVALPDGMYGKVENTAASWDFVSWGTRLYNGARSVVGNSASINTLKTQGGALKAHLYDGRTYENAMNKRFDVISHQ